MARELQSLLDFDVNFPIGFWCGAPSEFDDISRLDDEDIFLDFDLPPHKNQADRSVGARVVHIRSHKGSGQRSIEMEDLKRVSHLPQARAAASLGLGATRFKSLLRELGLRGWPYRTVRSLRGMSEVISVNRDHFRSPGECSSLLKKISKRESAALLSGLDSVSAEFKLFRSAVYKLKALSKHSKEH